MAAVAIATSVGTSMAKATGRPYQNHLFWDSVNSNWWLLYYSSTQTLSSMSSAAFSSWSAGAGLSLTLPHLSEGRNLAVAFNNISGNAVVHVGNSYNNTVIKNYHTRATISGTTLSWGVEATVDASHGTANAFDGESIVLNSANTVFTMSGCDNNGNFCAQGSTGTDTGTAFTNTWGSNITMNSGPANPVTSEIALSLGSSKLIGLSDNGVTAGTLTNFFRSVYSGTTWNTTGNNVLGSALGTAQDTNDWNAIIVGSTIYLIYRTGANTYGIQTSAVSSGTSWAAGTAIPTQSSKAAGGIALATDGTSLWMFIIDSDSANTIRYCQLTGTTWGAWTALETTTATRTALSAYPVASNNLIGVCWTQTNGSDNDIYGETLSLVSSKQPSYFFNSFPV